MDKVDYNKRYLEFSEGEWWQEQVDNFLNAVLFKLDDISSGYIVEFGTFRCVSFNKLIQRYGEDRCIGFDIVNYVNHPLVTEIDVRNLNDSHNIPIAVAINDISNWHGSPQSRKSALDFTIKNLTNGGYYIDNNIKDIPCALISEHFKLIKEYNFHTLWKRS